MQTPQYSPHVPRRAFSGFALFRAALLLRLAVSLHADGEVDASFHPPRINGGVNHIRVLPDTRILIAGSFTKVGDTPRASIARLHPHGELDTSFDPGVGPNGSITHFDLQPGGDLLIAGTFTQVSGQPRNGWARLNAAGVLDTAYAATQPFLSISTGARGPEIFALPDGRALLTGPSVLFSLSPFLQRAGVLMLGTNGTGDASFNMTIPNVTGALPVADGKFLVHGVFSTPGAVVRHGLARVDGFGALDPSFEAPGLDPVFGVIPAFSDAQRRVLYVQANALSTRVYRSGPDGDPDGTFVSPELNGAVMDCAFQSDGRLVLGGDFTEVNGRGNPRPRLARLLADGSLDPEFQVGNGGSSTVQALAIQADGRILVGGSFVTWNDTDHPVLVRLIARGGPPPPPQPRLANPTWTGETFQVQVPTVAGAMYSLERRAALGSGDWAAVSPPVTGDGSPASLSDAAATGDRGFYRVAIASPTAPAPAKSGTEAHRTE